MKIKNGFLMKKIAGKFVVVPVGNAGHEFQGMIQMNQVSAFLWEMLGSEHSQEELVGALLEKYEVSEEQAACDVKAFVEKLSAAGIID